MVHADSLYCSVYHFQSIMQYINFLERWTNSENTRRKMISSSCLGKGITEKQPHKLSPLKTKKAFCGFNEYFSITGFAVQHKHGKTGFGIPRKIFNGLRKADSFLLAYKCVQFKGQTVVLSLN